MYPPLSKKWGDMSPDPSRIYVLVSEHHTTIKHQALHKSTRTGLKSGPIIVFREGPLVLLEKKPFGRLSGEFE